MADSHSNLSSIPSNSSRNTFACLNVSNAEVSKIAVKQISTHSLKDQKEHLGNLGSSWNSNQNAVDKTLKSSFILKKENKTLDVKNALSLDVSAPKTCQPSVLTASSFDSKRSPTLIQTVEIPKHQKDNKNIIANEILILQNEKKVKKPLRMNLFEAFGMTSKFLNKTKESPLIVFEMPHNGSVKRFLVPLKYSMEAKWILHGRRIYVLMGHSFVEQRPSLTLMSAFMFVPPMFRPQQNYFRCLDCDFSCLYFEEDIIPCPIANILKEEMNFPYDYPHNLRILEQDL